MTTENEPAQQEQRMERTEEVKVENTFGLHFRPASQFVAKANEFESDIYLARGGKEVNGKSIMEVLLLAAEKGSSLRLRIAGKDAGEAMEALRSLFTSKFGEE